MHYYSTILPEDERAIREKLENAISAGTDYDVEFRIRRTDGAIRFLRGIGHHNPSQEIGEYVGITMDITDRRNAERERERLRQLEADLARINRVNMMGELAAALAHEIKQPIAASITSANALLRWLAHDPSPTWKERGQQRLGLSWMEIVQPTLSTVCSPSTEQEYLQNAKSST